jgi:hypothetical protein
MLRRNKVFLTFAVIAVVLIAVRAALPYVIENRVNATLHGLEGYDGRVEDIDLALWRGAYRVEGIHVDQRAKGDRKENTPFFNADVIDVSVEWRSLLKGSLVAEVVFDRPRINLVQEDEPEDSQLGQDGNWQEEFKQLFPFRFNTVEIREGTVSLLAPGIQTKDALTAEHINGRVTNLTNVANANKETFADFALEALVLGDAPAKVSGSLDPWAKDPTFDVNLEVKQVKLPKVNPWLREYIKADAEAGDFELFMEIAAAEGKFKGYAKPIMQNVNMTSSEEKDGALRKLWEGVLDFAANVLENKKEDQVAARASFTGTIENPEASIWETIASVVRNAFVSAFARSLEGSVTLRDVRENLGSISQNDEGKSSKDEKVSKEDDAKKRDKSDAKREAKRDDKSFGPRSTG